jgi:hypothetical protein
MNLAPATISGRRSIIAIFVILSLLVLTSCNKPVPPVPSDPLATCLPKDESDSRVRLAIVQFDAGKDETQVRVVAYAGAEPAEFALPVYYLSRGRWLIGEKNRSYLVDAQCRQYSLHDRHDAKWTDAPPDGVVKLKPGAAFETVLDYPPLPPNTTRGALIYGAYVIPFSILPSATRRP